MSITGAAATLTLDNGQEILMSPLSDKDIDEIDLWLQQRMMAIARGSLTPDMTPEERAETLDAAMRQASRCSMLSGQGVQLLATVGGMARLVWQSAKRNHPDIKLEDIRGAMLNEVNVRRANAAFELANKNRLQPKKVPATNHRPRRGKKR